MNIQEREQQILEIIESWKCCMKSQGLLPWDNYTDECFEELKNKIKETTK